MKARIKSVSFRSCISIGQFQTVHVEASADVPTSMKPESVLSDLQDFVAGELAKAQEGVTREVVVRKPAGTFREKVEEQRRKQRALRF